eukprot:scpid62306/ scgid28224/ Serine carboxypeptidase-like 34
MPLLSLPLLVVAGVLGGAYSLSQKSDKITHLPGAPRFLKFDQYSGYASVGETDRRALFYWFVETQSKQGDEPLMLWLNGGPGCSSLAGLLTENGPFVAQEDATLRLNEFSWNKLANVIYLESPSGVGFSYSNVTKDYIGVTDGRAAHDIVDFLVQFFEAYPQFSGRKFFISGESYGGHYVPTTAKAILEYNAKTASPRRHINLQGIVVGNAWTLPEADNLGMVQTWLGYNLITARTGHDLIQHCNLSNMILVESSGVNRHITKRSAASSVSLYDRTRCEEAQGQAYQEIGNIQAYSIYQPVCTSKAVTGREAFLRKLGRSSALLNVFARKVVRGARHAQMLKHRQQADATVHAERATHTQTASPLSSIFGWLAEAASAISSHVLAPKTLKEPTASADPRPDPCVEQWAIKYLNRPEVQKALHAKPTTWSECNMEINGAWSHVDFLRSMVPVHVGLMQRGVKVFIYSGDTDSVVPTHGTRNWIGKMVANGQLIETEAWAPWQDGVTTQVGGYRNVYNYGNFTFATVHGAGHMVPAIQPRRALDMLRSAFRTFGVHV